MSKARRASLIAAGAALIQLLTVGAALSDPSRLLKNSLFCWPSRNHFA
jgi:hypothetical protein